jgi:hypothetical protein
VQDVKFFIRKGQDTTAWKLVVDELNKRGFSVYTKYEDCDVALVISGLYTNPSLFKKSYLFFAKSEWSDSWDAIFGPILMEYYTVMFDMSAFNLEQVIGLMEDTYNNETNKPRS